MSDREGYIDLSGGGSVYCISRYQMEEARRLGREGETAERINRVLAWVREQLTRNEQAALAFLVIDELVKSHTGSTVR
ncbi:MAG: hypothetical protein N2595_09860 [bacterium]|nr:hypothetical protein [bacterium]